MKPRIDVRERKDMLEFIIVYNEYKNYGYQNMIAGGLIGGIIGGIIGYYIGADKGKEITGYGLLAGAGTGSYVGAIMLYSALEKIKNTVRRYDNPVSRIPKSDFIDYLDLDVK